MCNWIGVVPTLKCPTADLNTTLGLALLVLFVAHGSGIATKGFLPYIKGYFEPYFIAPLAFFINVAGEFGKTVSHSFRLFGNILGGGLIIVVISHLVHHLFVPIFLFAFFGFFTGTIQAFVFMMLALVYISVQRKE
jgi:F-type H+-transporting ATPase subunit a